MIALLLLACAGEADTAPNCEATEAAAELPVPMGNEHHCGTFPLTAGEHAYLSVFVSADAQCEGATDGAVSMPYLPIYTNMSNDEPKWTFDVLGDSAGEGALTVTCDDGTTWTGFFVVS
jgi:hypothetical protein